MSYKYMDITAPINIRNEIQEELNKGVNANFDTIKNLIFSKSDEIVSITYRDST